jgi:hypothetical protein
MMTNAAAAVVVVGARATRKSTVTWQVFSDLLIRAPCGYLDIDQIGMLQPPPDTDPHCHRFKVHSLAEMVWNARRESIRYARMAIHGWHSEDLFADVQVDVL